MSTADIDELIKNYRNAVIDHVTLLNIHFSKLPAQEEAENKAKQAIVDLVTAPVPMLLHCPHCGHQHIDCPSPETGWQNPPHRTHLCALCHRLWRPSNRYTVGVERIESLAVIDPSQFFPALRLKTLSLLKEVEWCLLWDQCLACPVCFGISDSFGEVQGGHKPDCQLWLTLSELEALE